MSKLSLKWILLGALALVALWVWSGYNGLISSRAFVDQQWSNVETQYQRRMDLIPNLVNTVQGAANFEQSTFTAVTEARTKWLGAGSRDERIDAANSFDSALSRLLVTVENYPDLQATQAFRDLMTQLEGTENRITVARKDFNEAAGSYNVRVLRFPGLILANLFGFEPEKFFEAAEGSDKAPVVDFTP